MMTDPISDFLTQIKNGYMAHKDEISLPSSNIKYKLANLLNKEGYVGKVSVSGDMKKKLTVKLIYIKKQPKINQIRRISSPGKRVYVKKGELKKVLSGKGISIISTPLGLRTDREARKERIGGELICQLWQKRKG